MPGSVYRLRGRNMVVYLQILLGVLVVMLLFTPALLLVFASIRVLRAVKDYSAILMAIGSVLLTIVSLDFLYSLFAALLFDPSELATYPIYTVYLFKALNYVALLFIAVGLLRFVDGGEGLRFVGELRS